MTAACSSCFPTSLRDHVDGHVAAAEPYLVAPIVEIADGRAVLDVDARARKQPDWTYDETDSGKWPAAAHRRTARGIRSRGTSIADAIGDR